MIFELGKDFDYLRGLHSFLYTKTDPPHKDSADTDCGMGSNPEGNDGGSRLGEWTGAGAGSGNGTGERKDRTGAEAKATAETESRSRTRAEVEAEGRVRAGESGTKSGIGDTVETRNVAGAVASQTVTIPACQHPSAAAASAVVSPVCPSGSLETGAGASPGAESGWRLMGEWQRLGGIQDTGAWGSEESGVGLDPGAVAGSSACPPEPVVRPKIRKQSSETHLELKVNSDPEPAQCGSATGPTRTGTQTKCVSAPPFFLTQTDRPNPELLFSFPPAERMREEEERMREWLERKTEGLRRRREDERRREEGEECRLDSDDDDIWEDLEVFNDKTAPFIKAEDR